MNTLRGTRDEVLAELTGQGVAAHAAPHLPEGIVLDGPYDLHRSAAVRARRADAPVAGIDDGRPRGRSAARRADPRPVRRPGAKTTHLAALMGDEGEVVAVEHDPRRGEDLRANAARLGAASVRVVVGDATRPDHGSGYDRVLVDPPCSDLGTLQSRPDARWRKTPEQVGQLRTLQRRILEAGAAAVRPGGRLVYSTCTISAPENERQMEGFLERHPEFGLTTGRPIRSDSSAPRRHGRVLHRYLRATWMTSNRGRPRQPRRDPFAPERTCPSCGEPWLRPTQLAGRYRCVYCLTRFQLMAYCPACGEHSTIVRMSDTDQMECVRCGGSMLKPV